MSNNTPGRRRTNPNSSYTADEALNQIAVEAEARLAAKRAARTEAREIRLKEIERQRESDESEESDALVKEDQNGDLDSGGSTPPPTRIPTRPILSPRDEFVEKEFDGDLRDLKKRLVELEDRYRKAMSSNAQLDNEKATLMYQVDILKDCIEEQEELNQELHRQLKEKTREFEMQKRTCAELESQLNMARDMLRQRDKLIEEHGLVLISDCESESAASGSRSGAAALVSQKSARLLEEAGEGTLEERLRRLAEEKADLQDQVRRLRIDMQEERQRREDVLAAQQETRDRLAGQHAQNDADLAEIQREASRQVNDYKFKLQKTEQALTVLEGTVVRLEVQVKRYKQQVDQYEQTENEAKSERRKLQRELREAQARVDELEGENNHLQKRLEKVRSARSALART